MKEIGVRRGKKQGFVVAEAILAVLSILFFVAAGYFFLQLSGLKATNEELRESLENERAGSKTLEGLLEESSIRLAQMEEELEEYEDEKDDLRKDLKDAERKYEDIEDSIGDALGTVEILNKKSQVDPQLLQKYSKVFFLNEHYLPSGLEDVPNKYLVSNDVDVHEKIEPFLEDLLEEMEDDDLDPKIVSGYRSFGTQANLKDQYVQTYGAGTANQFSADQGYSEHQLGTTVDFSNGTLLQNFTSFDETEEYEWLLDNAYKYGFVLSYPEGNSYYLFEPWHWRFVGKDLAKYLERKDLNFYDVDQRTIDEYTATFWDK